MLILKEPLELKSLFPIINQSDGFYDRMNANYQVLWAKYGPEELFHIMSQPPELYINEGERTTFITQNENHTTQEMRLEMVYNLMNRLMMAGSSRFTYQDTVYVQTMLQKLGIKNVSEFMKQLYEMQEDTQNVRQLSNLYETNLTVLKRAVRKVKGALKTQESSETWETKEIRESREMERSKETHEAAKTQEFRWLHQEIFRHLKSFDVYHTVTAFQKDAVHYHHQIRSRETGMADQVRTLSVFRLHELENQVLMEEHPLITHRVNLYEEGIEETYQDGTILNELAGAVLLNLSDNFYQLRVNEMRENRVLWYQFQGDLKQALKDTLERFKTYHLRETFGRSREIYRSYQESVNAFRRQEIAQIREVIRSEEMPVENAASHPYSEEEVQKILLEIREELRKRQEEEQTVLMELTKLAGERERIRQSLETENRSLDITSERMHRLTGIEELRAIEEINQVNRELAVNFTDLTEDTSRIRTLEEVYRMNEENRRRMEEEEEAGKEEKTKPGRVKEPGREEVTKAGKEEEEGTETGKGKESGKEEETGKGKESGKEEETGKEEGTREIKKARRAEGIDDIEGKNIFRPSMVVQIDKKRTREETLLLLEHPELAERYFQGEKELLDRIMNLEGREAPDQTAVQDEKRSFDQSVTWEEREWIHRILSGQKKDQEYAGRNLSPKEQERFRQVLRRAEEEITVRLAVQEEKQAHISEEIQLLKQMMDSLEGQDAKGSMTAQLRERLGTYRRADQENRGDSSDYVRSDIKHRQRVLSFEQIHTELETFLTYLRFQESLESESISRIQEALAGKKRARTDAGSKEVVVKKLVVLRDTLTELEKAMKIEQPAREEMKAIRQQPQKETLTEHPKTLQKEAPAEHPKTAETETRQRIEEEVEIRRTYVKTLRQIHQIIDGCKIEEKDSAGADKVRQARSQQKTLLKLLHSSEVLLQSEADRQIETIHVSEQFDKKRQEAIRTYLNTIGERHISEERFWRTGREISRVYGEWTEDSREIRREMEHIRATEQAEDAKHMEGQVQIRRIHREDGQGSVPDQQMAKDQQTTESPLIMENRQIQKNQGIIENRQIQKNQGIIENRQVQKNQGIIENRQIQKNQRIAENLRILEDRRIIENQRLFENRQISRTQMMSRNQKVQLYHKPTELFDRETVMEEIQNKRAKAVHQNTENIHISGQTYTQKNIIEKQIQVQTDNLVKQNTGNINEMIQKGVQRGVQRQIDSISNQVYHRLERKLSDDRKRRGY